MIPWSSLPEGNLDCPLLPAAFYLWYDSEDEEAKPARSESVCELVWQGAVQSRSFNAFRFQVRIDLRLPPSSLCRATMRASTEPWPEISGTIPHVPLESQGV